MPTPPLWLEPSLNDRFGSPEFLEFPHDFFMLSTQGDADWVAEWWPDAQVCQTIKIPINGERRPFTLSHLLKLIHSVHESYRSYRLANYQSYWFASTVFETITELWGCKPKNGPAASKRGCFGQVVVERGRRSPIHKGGTNSGSTSEEIQAL